MTYRYYSWRLVACLFVILAVTSGLGFYNHAVMLQALVDEKAFPMTLASSAVSVFFLAGGVAGLLIAGALEKYDVRCVISVGAVLAGAALLALSYAHATWHLLVLYALFGIGFSASGLLPATTLVTRWFETKRAIALSITTTGLSVGGLAITPASALLIESVGIDRGLNIFALAYLLGIVPICWWGLKSTPEELGLDVDGTKPVAANRSQPEDMDFKAVMRDRYFWGISVAYIFLMLAQVGAIAHHYGIVGSFLSGQQAAMALGIIPVASLIGRLIGGYLLASFSTRRFAQIVMLVQSASLATLGLSSNVLVFLISLALFGITIGNLLMLQPFLIAEAYGRQNYSRVFSLSTAMSTLGIAGGPFVMGLMYVQLGNYHSAYIIASLEGLIGLAIFLFVTKFNRA